VTGDSPSGQPAWTPAAAHAETAHAETAHTETAHTETERTRVERIDPPVVQAPEPEPAPLAPEPAPNHSAEAATMMVWTVPAPPRDSGQAAPVGAGSQQAYVNAPAQPQPPSQSAPPSRRLRALIVAMLATIVLVGSLGVLLVIHPWVHPPVLKPTGLSVSASGPRATSSVQIHWSGPATGPVPDTYEVLRDNAEVATIPGTETRYTNDGLIPSTSYQYQVIAVRGGRRSPASAPLSAQTSPLQPTGLTVKSRTTSSLAIAWAGPADGPAPDQYKILRDGVQVATVPGSATSYTDKSLAPDTTYRYQVIAVTGSEQSRISATLASAHTARPALSAAVLDWSGQVAEKEISLDPAWPPYVIQPGQSTQDSWTVSPDCSSGPCDATLTGTFEGRSINVKLTRSGLTYTGTGGLSDWLYCDVQSYIVPTTLSLSITLKSATTQGNTWTAASFSGQETINTPAYTTPTGYACEAITAQLTVKGS